MPHPPRSRDRTPQTDAHGRRTARDLVSQTVRNIGLTGLTRLTEPVDG